MHPLIWNISPILVEAGPLVVRWYGALFGLGFIFGASIMNKIFVREGQSSEKLDSLVGWMVLGTIVGARLGHTLIYEPEIYLADPIRILKIWEGGLASHGGTLGAMLSAWWWNRKNTSWSYLQFLDLICVPTALVTAFIRLANFFNSEILGRPTDSIFAIVFQRVDSVPRHPAMLYESAAYLVNFLLLVWMFQKHMNRRPGLMFGSFVTVLFTARFLIEFVKEPQVSSEIGMALDYGQLLSVPFVIVGLVLVIRSLRNPPLQNETALLPKGKKAAKKVR